MATFSCVAYEAAPRHKQLKSEQLLCSIVIFYWIIYFFQYHYTFTSFDVESLDLEDFQYNQVNITAFRYHL
jgi:hypothetical protein